MRQNPGPAGRPPQQDEVTVRLTGDAHPAVGAQAPPPDGVTVLVPGAVLAPAPTPHASGTDEAPVFVDDSGTRKRLLRLAGVLIALLSIGFIAIVGVALAVPNVATSVGLDHVVPYIVPGGAVQPPPKAVPASPVQVAAPKPKPAVARTTEAKPVVANPTTTPAPVTETTAVQASTTASPTTGASATQAPVTQAPGGPPTGGTQAPAGANPPAANTNPAGGDTDAPADQPARN